MQNADPRLNVSQQQQTAVTVAQPLNNVNLAPGLNTQNNGLNPVVGIGPVGNQGGPVIPGVPGQIGGPGNAGPPIGPVPGAMGGVNPSIGGVNQPVNIGGPPGWLQNELANLQSQQTTLQEQVRQSSPEREDNGRGRIGDRKKWDDAWPFSRRLPSPREVRRALHVRPRVPSSSG